MSPMEGKNELKWPSCKYKDTEYFQKLVPYVPLWNPKFVPFWYKFIFTLTFDEFRILINDLNANVNILATTEWRIKKDLSSSKTRQLHTYSIEPII